MEETTRLTCVKRVKHPEPNPDKGGDPFRRALGLRIRNLRRQCRMTGQEVADAINVGKSTISKWERGGSTPDAGNVRDLCNLFRVSADWLLREPGNDTVVHVSRSGVTQLVRAVSTGRRDFVPAAPIMVGVDSDTIPVHGKRDVELLDKALEALRTRGGPDEIANALAWVEGVDG